jgi:hypothetical protein
VERDPSAIKGNRQSNKSVKPEKRNSVQEEKKNNSMIDTSMPSVKEGNQSGQLDEYVEVTTYCCGCIPQKKRVLRSEYNISMTNSKTNLKEQLIQK